MAAKIVTEQSSIQTETVAQSLNINRFYNMGPGAISSLEAGYNINLNYVENQFLVDVDGNRTRLLAQGMNPKSIFYPQEKVGVFMLKVITVDGIETTLGAYLADLMDAEIVLDMNKPTPVIPVV